MNPSIAFLEGLGGGEILVICVLALMLFGSKNIPKMARTFGKVMGEFRRAAQQVSDEITKVAEEEPPAPRPVQPQATEPRQPPAEPSEPPQAHG